MSLRGIPRSALGFFSEAPVQYELLPLLTITRQPSSVNDEWPCLHTPGEHVESLGSTVFRAFESVSPIRNDPSSGFGRDNQLHPVPGSEERSKKTSRTSRFKMPDESAGKHASKFPHCKCIVSHMNVLEGRATRATHGHGRLQQACLDIFLSSAKERKK